MNYILKIGVVLLAMISSPEAKADWGGACGAGFCRTQNPAGNLLYWVIDPSTGQPTWMTLSRDGRFFVPYNGIQQTWSGANTGSGATLTVPGQSTAETPSAGGGFESAHPTKWPNLFKRNGNLYYRDQNGSAVPLHVNADGNVTYGGQVYPHIDAEAKAYWNWLKEKDKVGWDRVSEVLRKPGYKKLAETLKISPKENDPPPAPVPNGPPPSSPGGHHDKSDPSTRAESDKPQLSEYDKLKVLSERHKTDASLDGLKNLFGDKLSLGKDLECHADPSSASSKKSTSLQNNQFKFSGFLEMVKDGTTPAGLPISGIHADLFFDQKANDAKTRNETQGEDGPDAGIRHGVLSGASGKVSFGVQNANSFKGWSVAVAPENKLIICGEINPVHVGGDSSSGGTEDKFVPVCCQGSKENKPEVADDTAPGKLSELLNKFKNGTVPDDKLKGLNDPNGVHLECRNVANPERVIVKNFKLEKKGATISVAGDASGGRSEYSEFSPAINLATEGATPLLMGQATNSVEAQRDVSNFQFQQTVSLVQAGDQPVLRWSVKAVKPQPPPLSDREENWYCSISEKTPEKKVEPPKDEDKEIPLPQSSEEVEAYVTAQTEAFRKSFKARKGKLPDNLDLTGFADAIISELQTQVDAAAPDSPTAKNLTEVISRYDALKIKWAVPKVELKP